MEAGSVLFLFLLGVSSLEAAQLSKCVEEDICSTIVFNQLALAELTENMSNLYAAYNAPNNNNQKIVNGEELSACQRRNQELQSQVTSLGLKTQECMQRDEEWDQEKINLRKDVEDLRRERQVLQTNKVYFERMIQKQEEHIQNLTAKTYLPVDCADIQVQGQTESGIYTIYPLQNEKSIEVLCDLESDEGGWTVFFTRQPQDEPVDFNESWDNFKKGFGDINTEYWLGNDLIHTLVSLGTSTLRIDGENFSGESRWAEWNVFDVADEEDKYQLILEQYNDRSTLGDSLSANNGSSFTTYDSDNDLQKDLNCAVGSGYSNWGKGGFWYNACGTARPTGPLLNTNYWNSACWLKWEPEGNKVTSFRSLSMKLRRQNYEQLVDINQ